MQNALAYLKTSSCRGLSAASSSCLSDEVQGIKDREQTGLILVSRTPNCFMEAIASDVRRNKKIDTVLSLCGEPVAEFLGKYSTAVIVVANDQSTAFRGHEVTQQNIQQCLTN